jgi:inner membrane transporter RhtA
MLSVQCGAAIAKQMFVVAGPLWTGTLRICFSALLLAIAVRPKLGRLGREHWMAGIPYGLTLGGMNLLFYFALNRIPLGIAVAVEFTGPLLVGLLGSKRLLDLLWGVLAVAGILLITPWQASQNIDPIGLVFALSAGAMWAAYILLGRRVSRVFPGSAGVAVGMLVAAVSVLFFLLFVPVTARFEPSLLLAGLGVAALSSALPYTLEMIALRAMPPRTFGILMSVEPAIAAACGWLVLRERLSITQWLAIALIIAASAGTTLSLKRVEQPVEV